MDPKLQELLRKARAAIRDGVPVEGPGGVNEAIANRTGGQIESYLALTDTVTRQLNPEGESREAIGPFRAGVQAFGQAASLGFSDELSGVVGGVRSAAAGEGFGSGFREGTDEARAMLDQGRQEQPVAHGVGTVAGSVAPVVAAGAPAQLARSGAAALSARGAPQAAGLVSRLSGAAAAHPILARSAVGGAEGLMFGLGTGEGNMIERAPNAAANAAAGVAAANIFGVGMRGAQLMRARRKIRGRSGHTPRGFGDDIVEGSGAPLPAANSEAQQAAVTTGRRIFNNTPEEIAQQVNAAPGARPFIQRGIVEEAATVARSMGSPKKAVQEIVSPAFRERLRPAFDDPRQFEVFMEHMEELARLEKDADILQGIFDAGRSFAVFGAGAGFSTALRDLF